MGLGERAFGLGMDSGELLPRRLRRVLGWVLLLVMVLSPATYIVWATDYSQAKSRQLVEIIRDHLSVPSTTTTVSGSR